MQPDKDHALFFVFSQEFYTIHSEYLSLSTLLFG